MEHTMTDLDDIIRTDLAALGAETARAIPGFDTGCASSP
jgi:hypothetical protein